MADYNFAKRGIVYLPIFIKPQHSTIMERLNFKVDTGADTTTISKLDLIHLGYGMDWIKKNATIPKEGNRPSTASGEKINAGTILLPIINLLGYEGKQWPFLIIMDEDKDFKNLLGHDLLAGFNYTFDNDNDIFSIHKTKVFNKRYDFLPGQEINAVDI